MCVIIFWWRIRRERLLNFAQRDLLVIVKFLVRHTSGSKTPATNHSKIAIAVVFFYKKNGRPGIQTTSGRWKAMSVLSFTFADILVYSPNSRIRAFYSTLVVCSGSWQRKRTTVWKQDWKHYHTLLGTTVEQRRQADHRLRCRDTRDWLSDMGKVCYIVISIHVTYLKTFIRLVIQVLKQYSITQPGVVPKLVATFCSPTASFIRLVVTWIRITGSGKNPTAWTEMEGRTAYREHMTVFWSRAQHHVTSSLMQLI